MLRGLPSVLCYGVHFLLVGVGASYHTPEVGLVADNCILGEPFIRAAFIVWCQLQCVDCLSAEIHFKDLVFSTMRNMGFCLYSGKWYQISAFEFLGLLLINSRRK